MKSELHADNIIVGSGMSAFAAAFALHRAERDFMVLDIGYDLDLRTEEEVNFLAQKAPGTWPTFLKEKLFPVPNASSEGVQKRLAFGSTFPYTAPPEHKIVCKDCVVESSHARGGYGNVWGAAVLPFCDRELGDWPVSIDSMRSAYQRVTEYLPVAEDRDSLAAEFPLSTLNPNPIPLSEVGRIFASILQKNSNKVDGALWGRARLAVENSLKPNRCQFCGFCLNGCAFGSIFNPRIRWEQLNLKPWNYLRGYEVRSFEKDGNKVAIFAKKLSNGTLTRWSANRVFLAAGAINSTIILARSLNLLGTPIPVKDAQYFFFPAMLTRGSKTVPSPDRFTLAEFFVEVRDKSNHGRWTHFQIYTFNRIFRAALLNSLGPIGRIKLVQDFIAKRFILFQGFLHSDLSANLFVTVDDGNVTITAKPNPESRTVAIWSRGQTQRLLGWHGLIPPLGIKFVPPGRSFHVGSSFPMSRHRSRMTTDVLGQPTELTGVHVVDAASFPTIPATTYAYSLMAHADRIVTETLQ
jgi:choline dehydrogenase-like flavoprotein